MSTLYFILLNLYGFQANPLGPQADSLIEETEPGARVLVEMFQKGINADLLTKAGEFFIQISKPVQSEKLFAKALELDPKHEAARKGHDASRKRLTYLKGRIETFDAEIQKTKDNITYNRKAAVLFHMGRVKQAIAVLDKGLSEHFGDREIMGLKQTFDQGMKIESMAATLVEQRFAGSISKKERDNALLQLGQYVCVGLGRLDTAGMTTRLKETFPDCDMKKINDVLSVFDKK